jgi:adenine-specific DNA-methyltransferase
MEFACVLARAHVACAAEPDFRELAAVLGLRRASTADVLHHLARLPGQPAFVHEHYSPEGGEGARYGRMYFTPPNAARIDAVRATLHAWRSHALIDEAGYDVLLATLIEAADRVANTTGVYAAFVKTWQPNAKRPLALRAPRPGRGNGCTVRRGDALELVSAHEPFDLLYLDPPYNNRQYAGYYHVPEVIALGWFDGPLRTRGKTGLIDDAEKRSDWSSARRCEAAFEALVGSARCRRIVMSYNDEGLIPETTIERVLKQYGRSATYRRYRRSYRRYRSDSDGENRNYRGDVVSEYLYCVDR